MRELTTIYYAFEDSNDIRNWTRLFELDPKLSLLALHIYDCIATDREITLTEEEEAYISMLAMLGIVSPTADLLLIASAAKQLIHEERFIV